MSDLSKSQKLCLLFGVSLLSFTGFLDSTIVSTALPDIQSSLNMSVTQLQWIMNAFFLGVSAFMASMGRVGDLYGRRKVFYIGTLIFTLASIGAGFSTSPEFLIICRAFQGITTAITIPVGITLIQVAHKKEEIAKAMSIFGSITGAGLALGPVVGGTLVTGFGWPAVFLVNVPFVVIGFLLCLVGVKESHSDTKMTLDYFGILFLTLTIGSLVFGMVEANAAGWGSEIVIISFIVTVISLIILIFVERSVAHPIMAGYLFRNRVFVPSMIFSFVGGSAMSVVLFIDPLYLHIILERSNFITGVILFVISITVVFAAYIVGHVYRMMGARFLMIIASVAYFIMSILHMMLGVSIEYALIIPAFIIMGIGWGIVNTVPGTALGENIHGDHLGVAIGALFSFFNIGAAVLLAVSVVIFHVKAFASLIAQFAQHHLTLSNMDKGYLQQFLGQPDQLHQLANKLDIDYGMANMANTIFKNAFVSGMHGMYLPVMLLAIVSFLGLLFLMKKEPAVNK